MSHLIQDVMFSEYCTYRPKMRMVNKFYEGRVFIVGGKARIILGKAVR